ncbi:MAG: M4 family metallopeptidase [Paludibacteraceae bacterium]|nr:M4 family metallopeptidase [Paludibacteraceae bacterium]
MKKFFICLFLAAISSATFASFVRVQDDFSGQNLDTTNIKAFLQDRYAFEDGTELVELKTVSDNIGMVHITLQQYVDGHAVEGAIILVHTQDGLISSVSGGYMGTSSVPYFVVKNRPRKIARQLPAKSVAQGTDYVFIRIEDKYRPAFMYNSPDGMHTYYIDAETNELIKTVDNYVSLNGTATTMYSGTQAIKYTYQDGENVLYDEDRNILTVEAKDFVSEGSSVQYYTNSSSKWETGVVAQVTLNVIDDDWWSSIVDGNPEFYIKILDEKNNVLYKSEYFSIRSYIIRILQYRTIFTTGKLKIEFWEMDSGIEGNEDDKCPEYLNVTQTTQGRYDWSGKHTSGSFVLFNNPAYDVHWGMEKTYDYYKTTFNMKSVDGKGAQIINLVNPNADIPLFKDSGFPNNSCSISVLPGTFVYGMGDLIQFGPLVAIDVMAHEFTHAVTAANAGQNLPGEGEGGALNEAFADMFGCAVERSAKGTTDWEVGAEVSLDGSCMRSLQNPKKSTKNFQPSPNTYKGSFWDPKLEVHTNAGVANFWFYLICNGGSGTIDDKGVEFYSVSAIGFDKAIKIAYQTLLYHVTTESNFSTIRDETLAATKELYGANSNEVIAVTNAWHAVGIGKKYVPTKSITVKAKKPTTWGNTISAWVWEDGNAGQWASLKKEGDWWSYSANTNKLNIIFVNGSTWSTNANQTVDIALTDDACIQLNSNGSNKCNYKQIDCSDPTPPTPSKEFFIVAKRSTGNYYFFTPNKVSGKDRLIAVDAGTSIRSKVDTVNTSSAYLWTLEDSGSGKLLKSHNGSYLTCTEAKTAAMASTGKVLKVTNNTDGTTTFSYAADASTTHYLSLANAGNDYFVFYANTNQVTHLLLMPKGNGVATNIEDVLESPKPKKFMRDGQILIERCDGFYNMMGQKVR